MVFMGRVVKVLVGRVGKIVIIIYKWIYFMVQLFGGGVKVVFGQNKFKNMVFIVDEVFMIGDFVLQLDGSVL